MKTPKVNKVLIAVDYDATAQKVAEAGYSLANAMNAEVYLLHVISEPVYYSSIGHSPIMGFTGYFDANHLPLETPDNLKEATLEYLKNVKKHLHDDKIKTIMEEGDFADSILKTAKNINADIIVIGTHSRKWLEKVLMGSVTEKVLENSDIPLYIVPTGKKEK